MLTCASILYQKPCPFRGEKVIKLEDLFELNYAFLLDIYTVKLLFQTLTL